MFCVDKSNGDIRISLSNMGCIDVDRALGVLVYVKPLALGGVDKDLDDLMPCIEFEGVEGDKSLISSDSDITGTYDALKPSLVLVVDDSRELF